VLKKEGWTLTGRVVRAGSEEGIPDAHVRIDGYVAGGSVTMPDGSTRIYLPPPPPTATTDARGEFRVPVSDSRLTLVARAEGYATRHVPLAQATLASRPLIVALEPSQGLFGFVLDVHGAPVADAQIELRADGLTQPLQTQAEEDGSFCVLGVPAGDVVVKARAAGGYTGELSAVVSATDDNDVVVVVSTEGSILVRVRTATGEPLAGFTLMRVLEPAGPIPFLTLSYLGRTDSEGACRLASEKLDPGATLGFVLPDLEASFPFGAAQWSGGENELEIEIPRWPDPSTLRFDWGPGAEDGVASTVGVYLRANDAGSWLGRAVDEQGSCSYAGLPSGTYRAIATVKAVQYDLGLFDVGPGDVRVVPLDPSICDALPRTSLTEQR
jgi:hypothetical protein